MCQSTEIDHAVQCKHRPEFSIENSPKLLGRQKRFIYHLKAYLKTNLLIYNTYINIY